MRFWVFFDCTVIDNSIIPYYDLRCRNADEWIKDTSGETALPEQISPYIYTVTNTLTNCTTSNGADTVVSDAAYSATITPISGYELKSVTVTMGGVDITSTVYADGVITISAVTGNLVIMASATAVVVSGYTNRVPLSVDENGDIYNGIGWIGATRLSSSGVNKDKEYSSAIGYIRVNSGDVIRIKGIAFNTSTEYVCAYALDHSFLGYLTGIELSKNAIGTVVVNGDLATVTLAQNDSIAWIRISAEHNSNDAGYGGVANPKEGPGSYLIVTVNEEITD